jgi:hypothetical protein
MTCKRAAIVRGQRLCAAGPGSDLKMGSSLPDSNSKILLPLERASCLLLERTLFTALQGDDWLWDGSRRDCWISREPGDASGGLAGANYPLYGREMIRDEVVLKVSSG